jgi:putative ABC transport system permease protein
MIVPPRIPRWLATRSSPPHLRDAYRDDLQELFEAEAARVGPARARFWYWRQAVTAVPRLLAIERRATTLSPRGSGMTIVDKLLNDLRYGCRVLVKAPGFTIAAVATLALGIGANTAIFSLIKTVMLTPLPYAQPEQLTMIWNSTTRSGITSLSRQEIVSYGENATSTSSVGGYTETNANLTGGDEPERVRAAAVTGNLFATLGVEPTLGRSFVADDSNPGTPATVMIGHGLWQRRFGGSPALLGQVLLVNGIPRTVIGIMPASFKLPLDYRATRPTELWFPLVLDRANLGQWGDRSYFGVARLRSGIASSAASSEFKLISDRWIAAGFVIDHGDRGLVRAAVPMQEFITGAVRRPLLILLGAVAVVLLIACANVVNLLLARADARRREIAMRAAIGARRGDIIRQLLTESVVLSALGGLGGIVVAAGAMQVLTTLRPAGLPRVEEAALDPWTLVFTAGLSILTGVIFGLAPAIQLARQQFTRALNEGGRGGAAGKVRLAVRRGLVVVQLACSVVLVIGAGLLLRSLAELNRIDLGFQTERVLTAQLQLPASDYASPQSVVDFYRRLTEQLAAQPGVAAVGAARVLPLARTIGDWSITIEGRPYVKSENPNGDYQAVTPGYFQAMGTTLVRGRFLSSADREDAEPVVLVNDTMAERYWPGQDAIGKRFQMGGQGSRLPMMTIVGIVRTSRHNAVVEEPRAEMYLPHAQIPSTAGGPGRAMGLVIKTAGSPLTIVTMLRETIRQMDRNLPIADVQTMDDIAATAMAGPRFAALLLGLFAALALTLAAIGTYATISLLVSERAHEIGIRLALGAERRTILGWILGEGLTLAGIGVGVGLAGAFFLTHIVSTLLYGVSPLDPVTFAAVPALLAGVALIASLLPARRAASVDPVTTLRQG